MRNVSLDKKLQNKGQIDEAKELKAYSCSH